MFSCTIVDSTKDDSTHSDAIGLVSPARCVLHRSLFLHFLRYPQKPKRILSRMALSFYFVVIASGAHLI
jgi:hypothetical protein